MLHLPTGVPCLFHPDCILHLTTKLRRESQAFNLHYFLLILKQQDKCLSKALAQSYFGDCNPKGCGDMWLAASFQWIALLAFISLGSCTSVALSLVCGVLAASSVFFCLLLTFLGNSSPAVQCPAVHARKACRS